MGVVIHRNRYTCTMQFTPQQLAGGVSYSDSTRIGNWVEDVCLRDYQKAHFEVRIPKGPP